MIHLEEETLTMIGYCRGISPQSFISQLPWGGVGLIATLAMSRVRPIQRKLGSVHGMSVNGMDLLNVTKKGLLLDLLFVSLPLQYEFILD